MGDQVQNYHVEYRIDVEASKGVEEITKFGEAIGNLVKANASFKLAIANIKSIVHEVDEVFRPKGKKRDYTYDFNIRTNQTDEKLERIKGALTEIRELTQGITLVINAGQKFDTQSLKSKAKKEIDKTTSKVQEVFTEKKAKETAKSTASIHENLTKVIGKTNSALINLTLEKEINIKSDAAKSRLNEILELMQQIKGASKITLDIRRNNLPTKVNESVSTKSGQLLITPTLTDKNLEKEQNRLAKEIEVQQEKEYKRNIKAKLDAFKRNDKREAKRAKEFEELEKIRMAHLLKKERDEEREALARKRKEEKERKQTVSSSIQLARRQAIIEDSRYGDRRRAAINRMQYSKAPSFRNLPVVSMFNTYMAYSCI